jgi:transposase
MTRRPRRNHTPAFKAKVAAIKGDRTLAQLAEQFDVPPNQITSWKAQLEEGAADPVRFGRRQRRPAIPSQQRRSVGADTMLGYCLVPTTVASAVVFRID